MLDAAWCSVFWWKVLHQIPRSTGTSVVYGLSSAVLLHPAILKSRIHFVSRRLCTWCPFRQMLPGRAVFWLQRMSSRPWGGHTVQSAQSSHSLFDRTCHSHLYHVVTIPLKSSNHSRAPTTPAQRHSTQRLHGSFSIPTDPWLHSRNGNGCVSGMHQSEQELCDCSNSCKALQAYT